MGTYRLEGKRRAWRRRSVPVAPPAPPAPAWSTSDRVAIVSLIVAVVATVGGVAQSVLAFRQVDAPYAALLYQEQVERTIEAADFMNGVVLATERWEAMSAAGRIDGEAIGADVEKTMIDFAALAQQSWLISERSQAAVAGAAEDFNRFAGVCLRPKYAGEAVPDRCLDLFAAHQRSLKAAVETITDEIRLKDRLRFASRQPTPAP